MSEKDSILHTWRTLPKQIWIRSVKRGAVGSAKCIIMRDCWSTEKMYEYYVKVCEYVFIGYYFCAFGRGFSALSLGSVSLVCVCGRLLHGVIYGYRLWSVYSALLEVDRYDNMTCYCCSVLRCVGTMQRSCVTMAGCVWWPTRRGCQGATRPGSAMPR